MAKKIMFSDKYGLTDAVLSGRKTQTRRIIACPKEYKGLYVAGFHVYKRKSDGVMLEWPSLYDADEATIDGGYILPKYNVGESIAIVQNYKDAGVDSIPCEDDEFGYYGFPAEQTHGWTNKMFVRADLMPHHISITNVRVERLQDISDDDCHMSVFWNRLIDLSESGCKIYPKDSLLNYLLEDRSSLEGNFINADYNIFNS